MIIRKATLDDLDDIANLERECFPVNEAATKDDFRERLKTYPNHFLLLFLEGKLVAFIDGFCTDDADLTDEMYENPNLHDESGDWQMIFGINTHPDYRMQGNASKLMDCFIIQAKQEKRLGVVLTCKKELLDYYSKFGFVDEGISESVHGGVVWNQMRLAFKGELGCNRY
ncbi:GNAT family N-acetyltransferase [Methanobrevibacter sp.]|uniref:GNAT family N-acetyltransferase n=1 Tax=Methanobrevibacter sp. TaxID=66852 RepID=UPI003868865B